MTRDLKRKSAKPSGHGSKKLRAAREDDNSIERSQVDETIDPNDHTNTTSRKPLMGEELRMLKDAGDLYQSSSFKLQIDALLPNVRPNMTDSRKATLDRFLHSLRLHIMSLPAIEPTSPVSVSRTLSKKGVAVPFALPHPTEEARWKFAFEPPTDMNVVGSWANQVCVKRRRGMPFSVDVTVEMPDVLFQEKDYLDARYFHKRSLYLAVIAQSLSSLEVDISYLAVLGDPRLTILVLTSKNGNKCDFSKCFTQVYIIPVISSSNPILLSRLSPSHVNVRLPGQLSTNPRPTPIYNSALLLSTYPKLYLLSTNALKHHSPSFSDAYTLLRVWANQRGYGDVAMCIRGFEGKGCLWNEVLAMVIFGEEPADARKPTVRKPLGKGLSSYQLFRAALEFLATQDFTQRPVFVKSSNGHKFSVDEYTAHHPAVFVDSTSTLNLLADVPTTSLTVLRHDARETLEQLNVSSGDDAFSRLFLVDQTHLMKKYDAVIRVDLTRAARKHPPFELVEYGSPDSALLAAISQILQSGLSGRTEAIAIFHSSAATRSVSEAQSPSLPEIFIGLIYDAGNAFRLVDHGPPVEEQDSHATRRFRELWGDRAELRRFKDGRIIESVVWEVATSDQRARIPVSIVRYLLHRHCGIHEDDIQTIQMSFDAKLRLPDDVSRLFQGSKLLGGFKPALSAFDNLVKCLKSLDDQVPLTLSSVSPVSEYLRYSSALAPFPIPRSTCLALPEPLCYLPVMDIILEFEKSTKWPDDIRTIQKVKLAFFETIATALMASNNGLLARVGVEEFPTSDMQDGAMLEIQTSDGWAFSARIWCDREATLLERLVSPPQMVVSLVPAVKPDEHHQASQALALHTRRFRHAPRHHRAVTNLVHCYTAYAGTVRLVKRWLAAHWLLATHVSIEAVEIICARPFVGSTTMLPDHAASVPKSKERGFALVVEFLRDWNFVEPIFVPMYEESGPVSQPAIVAVSSKQGVWTIATAEDTSGRMWTSNGPDMMAALRLRALAKEACKILQDANSLPSDIERLFSHAMDDYDVLIELKPNVLPRYHQAIDADPVVWSKDRAVTRDNNESASRPGFDPAWLLWEDLQRTYSDTLKFFYDVHGGHRIGGVWLPAISDARQFRVMAGFSSTPIPKEKGSKEKHKGSVALNKQAVLDEIERLGTGLIKRIVLREGS